jgi:hypothetical protein
MFSGLCVASLLLLAATSLLGAQHYAGRYEAVVLTQPYAFSCRDWFWYVTITTAEIILTTQFGQYTRDIIQSGNKPVNLCLKIRL